MWVRCDTYAKFCLENLKGGDYLEDLGIDEKIILEWIVRE
jgi:hypothetical protein